MTLSGPLRLLGGAVALLLIQGCSTLDTVGGWIDGERQSALGSLPSYQAELSPVRVWSHSVGAGRDGEQLRLQPVRSGKRLYAADGSGRVEARLLPAGTLLWERELSEQVKSGVALGEHNLYLGSVSGELWALDLESGAVRWRVPLLSEILAPVVESSGIVVVRSGDGRLRGLDRDSGEERWSYQRELPALTLRGTGSPVVVDERVVAGLDSGEVVALSLQEGRELWLQQVTAPRGRTEVERLVDIDADPVVAGDHLYVISYQGELVALGLEQGEVVWRRKIGGVEPPVVVGERLFLSDQQGSLWGLERNGGRALWRQQALEGRTPTAPVATPSGHLVVGDRAGVLHWIAQEDGHLGGRFDLGSGAILAPPLRYDPALIVQTESGEITLLTP